MGEFFSSMLVLFGIYAVFLVLCGVFLTLLFQNLQSFQQVFPIIKPISKVFLFVMAFVILLGGVVLYVTSDLSPSRSSIEQKPIITIF